MNSIYLRDKLLIHPLHLQETHARVQYNLSNLASYIYPGYLLVEGFFGRRLEPEDDNCTFSFNTPPDIEKPFTVAFIIKPFQYYTLYNCTMAYLF